MQTTIFNIRPKGLNVGNEAIALALRKYLYQAFNSVVNIVTVPATAKYESGSYAGLTPKTIYDINQYADGVIVGGGNLYENGELDVSLDALEALSVPLMLFSLSRGRMYDKSRNFVQRTDTMPDRTLIALHNKACISLARDESTEKYLKQIGCDNVLLGGCPTIFLNRIVERLPVLTEDSQGVLISIRQPQLMSIPPADQARVHTDIVQLVQMLKDMNFKQIRLLCHDHRDISFAASFPDLDFIYTGDIYDYLSLLKNCQLNIAYRLHACLPCLSFGTPTVKISYDERAVSLMNTIGCDFINVNMMKVMNTTAAVKSILDTLPLPRTHSNVMNVWNDLDATMLGACEFFAKTIEKSKHDK